MQLGVNVGKVRLDRGVREEELAVGLSLLNKQLAINPPLQMAGASLMVIPIVIVSVLLQKHIVRGVTLSGLK